MNIQYKYLTRAIENYKTLQEKQITLFETQLLPDLESLNFERAAAFADLKNNLDHFLNLIHDDTRDTHSDFIVFYQNELHQIVLKDDMLKKKISEHRNELKQHMGETNKNKKAFHGYAGAAGSNRLKTICFNG
jgi:hypothetical protein